MSIEDRIRKRKGYTFFRNLFQRLKEMGVDPKTSLEVLGLFHEVIDNLKGYRYAWRAVKNKETLELSPGITIMASCRLLSSSLLFLYAAGGAAIVTASINCLTGKRMLAE